MNFGRKPITNNQKILKRIRELTAAILTEPYLGIGKPEALKHQLSGKWSRRITQSDRIVYQVQNEVLYIFSLKGHYNKL